MKRISKVSVASNNSNNPPECILEQTARIQKRVKNPQHCNIEWRKTKLRPFFLKKAADLPNVLIQMVICQADTIPTTSKKC